MPHLRRLLLFVGGRYLHCNGRWVRVIERIDGQTVYWRDHCGPGRCQRTTFSNHVMDYAHDCPPEPISTHARNLIRRARSEWEVELSQTGPLPKTHLRQLESLHDRLAAVFIHSRNHLPEPVFHELGECLKEIDELVRHCRAQAPISAA